MTSLLEIWGTEKSKDNEEAISQTHDVDHSWKNLTNQWEEKGVHGEGKVGMDVIKVLII